MAVTTRHSGKITGEEAMIGCGCQDQSHAVFSNRKAALFVKLEDYSLVLPLEIVSSVDFQIQKNGEEKQGSHKVFISLIDNTQLHGNLLNIGFMSIKVDGKGRDISITEIQKLEVVEGTNPKYQPKKIGNGQTELVLSSLPKRVALNLTNAGFVPSALCPNGCFVPESLNETTKMVFNNTERTITWKKIASMYTHTTSSTRTKRKTIKVELKDNSNNYTNNIDSVGIMGFSKLGKFSVYTFVSFNNTFRCDFNANP